MFQARVLCISLALASLTGCESSPPLVPAPPVVSVAPPPEPTAANLSSGALSASAASIPAPSDAAPSEVECRAKDGDRVIELLLTWDKNVAHGTLRTTAGGKAQTQSVKAELYKGLVLVDPPGSKNPTDRLATVQDEGGKKSIQVGDWKKPWLPCD